MSTGMLDERFLTFADLEGETCPPGLRKFGAIWVAWRSGSKSGKLHMQLNNREGRRAIAAQLEASAMEKPGTEFWVGGALIQPGSQGEVAAFNLTHGIPDRCK